MCRFYVHDFKVRTKVAYNSQECNYFNVDARTHAGDIFYINIFIAHASFFPFNYMDFLSCDIVEIRL